MGLVLVCPQCQAKVDLSAQKCQYCQADLRHLPKDQRLYAIGQPGPPPSPQAPVREAIPVLESAGVPVAAAAPAAGRVRRPYIRRYAAEPIAVTHPTSLKKAAGDKPEVKKAKKPRATPKKKK